MDHNRVISMIDKQIEGMRERFAHLQQREVRTESEQRKTVEYLTDRSDHEESEKIFGGI